MPYIVTTGNNTTITLPVGTTVGTLFIKHHNVTVQGTDRDACILRLDDMNTSAHSGTVFPNPPQTPDGLPVSKFTLKNMTIDANQLATLVSMVGVNVAGCLEIELDTVKLIGHVSRSYALLFYSVKWTLKNVAVYGDGYCCLTNGGTGVAYDIDVEGCMSGFVVSQSGSAAQLDIRRLNWRGYYWCAPTSETVTPTAFGDTYVDVVSQNSAVRDFYDVIRVLTPVTTVQAIVNGQAPTSNLRIWDRVEASDGRWAQIESVDLVTGYGNLGPWHKVNSFTPAATPAGPFTIMRVTLGRLMQWTSPTTRLSLKTSGGLPPNPWWRHPDGVKAPTPSMLTYARVEICNNGNPNAPQTRVVDTGGIHFTLPTHDSQVVDSTLVGGFSDIVTLRGTNNRAIRVSTAHGQDMGFTLTGANALLIDCVSDAASFQGVWVGQGGDGTPASALLFRHSSIYCGTQKYGNNNVGYGVYLNTLDATPARLTLVELHGGGNATALVGGLISDASYRDIPVSIAGPLVRQASSNQISLARGEARSITVAVVDPDGGAVDMTNALLYFTVRARIEDSVPVLTKRSLTAGGDESQISVSSPTSVFVVHLDAADIELLKPTTYVYDCWVVLPTGEYHAVIARSDFVVYNPGLT